MHAYTVRIVIAGMAVYIQTTFPVGRAMYVYVWFNISQEGNARSLEMGAAVLTTMSCAIHIQCVYSAHHMRRWNLKFRRSR